ncbi:sugar phosphate isomerase/epimerase family protein [Paenibacillus agilis]|uniref:Sugar phosphate isomerase/epimerase n=1 Tax=Paenibacillus agilis TaxID=3020863 RepID=A0A559IHR4_9BACL|nr:sugar phosphate isomerase/epimerase [Paenibacillus agilis]TVX87206.1 sugar phosphate isomerase/epimerase [Paenibacillus agilis]
MQIGLQLYTVREEAAKDFTGTLSRVAEMGYKGVELAGYGNLKPGELASTLKSNGLQVAGSHVGIEQLDKHLDEHIEMSLAIGNRYLICPWLDKAQYETMDALKHTASILEQAADQAGKHGIQIVYHNHEFEFTTAVAGKTVHDWMFELVPSSKLLAELDVCWIQYADFEPLDVIVQHAKRLPLIHYKDLKRTPEGPLTVELGQGELDLVAIARTAEEIGVEWLIVEQDNTQRCAMESSAANLAWIKNHLQLV